MDLERVFATFPTLESANLKMDIVLHEHLDDLFAIYSNERVFDYCGIIPKHNKDTVSNMIGHFARDFGKRSRVKWGIFPKAEPERLAGIIEAMEFNQKVGMATLGYFLAEEFWGRGIASEAVGAVVRFLFEEARANRLQAEVMPPNDVSKRVLLKNGFIREGLLRQASLWSGQGIVDLEIYGILRSDYEELTPSVD